jgi:hypothetical protein
VSTAATAFDLLTALFAEQASIMSSLISITTLQIRWFVPVHLEHNQMQQPILAWAALQLSQTVDPVRPTTQDTIVLLAQPAIVDILLFKTVEVGEGIQNANHAQEDALPALVILVVQLAQPDYLK